MLNPYTKAILGALLALTASLAAGVEDGSRLTSSEVVTAILTGIGGLAAVWAAHATIKWIVGGLSAFGASIAVALQDGAGISAQEWLVAAVAGLTALVAVLGTDNTPASNAP